jgi:hypothetical protein
MLRETQNEMEESIACMAGIALKTKSMMKVLEGEEEMKDDIK